MVDYIQEIEKIIRNKIKSEDIGKLEDNKNDSPKKLYAVFGKNISYSLSPIMHNTIFSKMNMNCEYDIIDNSIEECLKWLKEKGSGANVTIPYKTEVIKFLNELSDDAKEIGAVNTIKNMEDGKLVGYNTDYIAIRELISKFPGKVLIFGSGGAAKAAVYGAKGRELVLVSRNPDETKVEYEKWKIKVISYEEVENEIKDTEIIINATPSVPEIANFIDKTKVVFDMRYNPLDIGLNRIAIDKGATIIHGLEMLAIQAAEAQRIWFNKIANSAIMLSVALDEMTKEK